ncbi:MAG TPA: M28 family peptidase, partial [Micropepsaceae bacterium]|nr:M28 family peptidase [Micropepsaceae bacterium]
MTAIGWRALVTALGAFRGEGQFPVAAYSEFMPPPRIGIKPSGTFEYESPFRDDDLWGWQITSRELERELLPGLPVIGRQIVEHIMALARAGGTHHTGYYHFKANPYWPEMLHGHVPLGEHYVFLSPLALSKTQDDKGRVRWTFFGASSDGPARGFWRSFFRAPQTEIPQAEALDSIRNIVGAVFGHSPDELRDLRALGFRIRPASRLPDRPEWNEDPLPAWTKIFLLDESDLDSCRYVLTFTPFVLLPDPIQRAYLAGKLHLLPSPPGMAFWGSPLLRTLGNSLPYADQILLQRVVARHDGKGIRVPQSGWLHRRRPGHAEHDPGLGALHETVRRTHRWQRVLRTDDDTEFAREDSVHAALFSTHPDDVRLYGKPMARNAQIWSSKFDAVLHGPAAGHAEIEVAMKRMEQGGSFGYRFFYPPMQVGQHAVFWHRPVIACWDARQQAPRVIECGLNGCFVATKNGTDRVELWPRMDARFPPPRADEVARGHSAVTEGGRFAGKQGMRREALTFAQTGTRAFEVRYWQTIMELAEGRYLNKNSGDCVRDSVTQKLLAHPNSDLDPLAEHLLHHYGALITRAKMTGRAITGDMPFRWHTDFDFPWMGGWLDNQQGRRRERDVITIIPGWNRGEAVIMGDHYDTAYMEDIYGERPGIKGDGARLAAAGADDNHSATATLMLGARNFLDLSRRGMLDCDIWLVHLTGEEFPADCLGARALTERIIEGRLRLRETGGHEHDLSQTKIRGVFVLDMVAHNNDHAPDIFQIAPGTTGESLWLSQIAAEAARDWAILAAERNDKTPRKDLGSGKR